MIQYIHTIYIYMQNFNYIKKTLNKLEEHHLVIVLATFFSLISILVVFGATNALAETCNSLSAGNLFKVSDNSAVYIITNGGKRMYFPNSEVYHTWYSDFSNITELPNVCVDNYPNGGGINYRPGSRLIKSTISQNVYAILPGNLKSKIDNEEIAESLYGKNWKELVRDISDVFDSNYDIGKPIKTPIPHNGQIIKEEGSNITFIIANGARNIISGNLEVSTKDDVRIIDTKILGSLAISGIEYSKYDTTLDPVQDGSNIGNNLVIKTLEDVKEENSNTVKELPEMEMKFVVTVPDNTPSNDTIYLYPLNHEGIKMTKTGPSIYELSLSNKDGSPTISYTYGRNNQNFATAEYISPDSSENYLANRGRSIIFEDKKIQTDTVDRWRWFPKGNITKESISEISSPDNTFNKRTGRITFRSGQSLRGIYNKGNEYNYDETAQHMLDVGYNWVTVRPSWDWVATNPLPKTANPLDIGISDNNNYTDEQIRTQIRAYKAKGLNVMIEPNICCSYIDITGQSEEWYQTYFTELERFLVHYAKIAEEEGVGALIYAIPEVSKNEGVNIVSIEQDKISQILGNIRNVFNGELGQIVFDTDNSLTDPNTSPSLDYIASWGKKLNFIYIKHDTSLVDTNSASNYYINSGVSRVLDSAKNLNKYFSIPIWIETGYKSVAQSWKGNLFYETGKIPSEDDSENSWKDHEYSGIEQARIISAFLNAIQDRTYIIGYSQSGYRQQEMPLLGDSSIRNKEAEDVWKSWNKVIFK